MILVDTGPFVALFDPEDPSHSTLEQFDALNWSEIDKWAKVVKFPGAKAD